jgi:hypothetical protein
MLLKNTLTGEVIGKCALLLNKILLGSMRDTLELVLLSSSGNNYIATLIVDVFSGDVVGESVMGNSNIFSSSSPRTLGISSALIESPYSQSMIEIDYSERVFGENEGKMEFTEVQSVEPTSASGESSNEAPSKRVSSHFPSPESIHSTFNGRMISAINDTDTPFENYIERRESTAEILLDNQSLTESISSFTKRATDAYCIIPDEHDSVSISQKKQSGLLNSSDILCCQLFEGSSEILYGVSENIKVSCPLAFSVQSNTENSYFPSSDEHDVDSSVNLQIELVKAPEIASSSFSEVGFKSSIGDQETIFSESECSFNKIATDCMFECSNHSDIIIETSPDILCINDSDCCGVDLFEEHDMCADEEDVLNDSVIRSENFSFDELDYELHFSDDQISIENASARFILETERVIRENKSIGNKLFISDNSNSVRVFWGNYEKDITMAYTEHADDAYFAGESWAQEPLESILHLFSNPNKSTINDQLVRKHKTETCTTETTCRSRHISKASSETVNVKSNKSELQEGAVRRANNQNHITCRLKHGFVDESDIVEGFLQPEIEETTSCTGFMDFFTGLFSHHDETDCKNYNDITYETVEGVVTIVSGRSASEIFIDL